MPVIPEGYAQANFVFEGLGVPRGAQVTLGVENASTYDVNELAESLWDAFAGNVVPFLSDQVTMVECRTKAGPNATGPEGLFTGSSTGTDSSDSGSPAVAYLVHKQTPYGGRTGRGRWYLPGCGESRVEPDGQVSSALVTDLNTALAQFLDDVRAQDVLPVVLHGPNVSLDIGPRTITSLTVDGRVATQRRRLR